MKKLILFYRLLLKKPICFLLALFISITVFSQQRQLITGRVISDDNLPITRASVIVKNTTRGTTTNNNGNFSIEAAVGEILVFSSVGFDEREITINNDKITVQLIASSSTLGDVVVVGYGTQKKVNLTGAVSALSGKELEGQVPTSVTSLLQGRLPGLFVTQSSGQPGKPNTRVLIRGLGTMNNSNPLILIDGVESTMDNINPDDVESISILKDASSSAIYGTRAANGVILITTKRGKSGPIQFNYSTSLGWQKAVRLPEHVSSAEYAVLLNEAFQNQGAPPAYTKEEIEKFRTGVDPYNYPNTNWVDLLLQGSGFTQNHSLGISGGTDASKYALSLAYFDQGGLIMMDATQFKRYNLRLNLDSKVNRWLSVGLNSSFTRSENREPAATLFGTGFDVFFQMANNTPPSQPVKNAAGEYVPFGNQNLVALIEAGGNLTSKNSQAVGSVFGNIQLAKGLTLKGLMGLDYRFVDNKDHYIQIQYSNGITAGPNQVRDYLERYTSITLQSFLDYTKAFKKHEIKGLLGISRQAEQFNINQLYRRNFPSNLIDQIDAGSPTGMTNNGSARDIKQRSYFGRVNYSFDNKYLFEANLRRDGSSKFAPDYRWGMFPSFSVGWRLSEESFFNNISWLNNLKLRGSWGRLGNHNIADYLYIGRISFGQNYPFGGNIFSGATQTQADVPDIAWETTTESNFAVDVGLFNNKFTASVDYYNKLTEDILTQVPVSLVFGLPAPVVNAGAMRNKGVELQLTHKNTFKNFLYNLSANVAFNKNTVVKYPKESLGSIWGYRYDGTSIRKEGESWDSFYGYEWIGQFQSDAEAVASPHITGTPVKAGDLKFKDQNGDGVIDSKDRIVLGNAIPKITYGFNVGLEFKNFDVSTFFQGVAKVFNTVGIMSMFPLKDGGTAFRTHLDRSIVENGKIIQQGHYPRTLIGGDSHHNAVFSSFWVSEVSYLRMKNLQIGYTLSPKITDRINLSKARVYFSGQNLLTFSRFDKSYDPEILAGNAHWSYPQVQFYTFGLNVTF